MAPAICNPLVVRYAIVMADFFTSQNNQFFLFCSIVVATVATGAGLLGDANSDLRVRDKHAVTEDYETFIANNVHPWCGTFIREEIASGALVEDGHGSYRVITEEEYHERIAERLKGP